MNLHIYALCKKVDVRAAIDLNHLIADCVVSEKWIEMHVEIPLYLQDAIEKAMVILMWKIRSSLADALDGYALYQGEGNWLLAVPAPRSS